MAIEPVLDWTTDYDIFDDEFVRDPYPVWEDLRAGECPVAHTARWGGSWMPTKYDDVVAFAQDVETFTSQQILVVPPTATARRSRTAMSPPRRSRRTRPNTIGRGG